MFDADAEVSAASASRAYDSRDSGSPVDAGSVTEINLADTDIDPATEGAIINIAATLASAPGYATAYPCADGRPTTANLNVAGPPPWPTPR